MKVVLAFIIGAGVTWLVWRRLVCWLAGHNYAPDCWWCRRCLRNHEGP